MSKQPKYIAYVDGSYQSSLNAGGYASIICNGNQVIKELYQGFLHTSNNRMELLAVIETLKYFPYPVEITIVSDSKYVVETITRAAPQKWFEEHDYSKKNLDL